MPSVLELARSSGLIFTGAVVERGRSTVAALRPSAELMIVRVDKALRADPVHGDLRGKLITVVPAAPEGLAVGQRAVFFTNSWIHANGIAAREVAHLEVADEAKAETAIAELPKAHLVDRLRQAVLVASGRVVRVDPVERKSFERNAARWAAAELELARVLRGAPRTSATVFFPTSNHPMWARAPRFRAHDKGIYILHEPSRRRSPSEAALPADALVAPDAADVQPESQLHAIEALLATIK